MKSATERKEELTSLYNEVIQCSACDLSKTRTNVVFGSGDPDSDLMFVGEAPGFHEDQQGKPFVGQAGKLLESLLAEIGLTRDQVFIANVLKCRPPQNRDPQPEEIERCRGHLQRQIELIQPTVICTLGNFSTKLLSGRPDGITKVHGREQAFQQGSFKCWLFPIFHPAAALYTPAMKQTLREDFLKLPDLLGRTRMGSEEEPEPMAVDGGPNDGTAEPTVSQMGLF